MTHGVEFLVVYAPGSEESIYAAARAVVARGLAESARLRTTTEGGRPALGVAFGYDILDGVSARTTKITRALEQAGGRVVGGFHFREGEATRYPRSRRRGPQAAPPVDPHAAAVAQARKKAARSRAPKPVYSKAYLAAKGMKRRNPVEQFRMPGGHSRMYLTDGGVLDVTYSSTDWNQPGAAKRTLRILPTSTGHCGTLVRDLVGKDLSADALLAAAIEADESAKMMYDSYPRHVYRSAARYYEGLTLALLQLAGQLQGTGWRTNPKAKVPKGTLVWQPIRTNESRPYYRSPPEGKPARYTFDYDHRIGKWRVYFHPDPKARQSVEIGKATTPAAAKALAQDHASGPGRGGTRANGQ